MADRPKYNHEQLEQFFNRIALPEDKHLYSVRELTDIGKLYYLALLLKHTLVRIPFENLTLHYSWHRTINVRPQHLYNKIVRPPSYRGGYCMENNSLFHTVLLSLGYDVFMAGARVYEKDIGKYGGFSHCVNIVIINDARYLVDVGYGANGPTTPFPVRHDFPERHIRAGSVQIRIVHEPIPQAVDQGQKVWILQQRLQEGPPGHPNAEWTPLYCFVDFEFLLEDIQCMNLSPWKSPSSWFTQKVVLSRFTTNLEGGEGETGEEPGAASEDAIDEGEIDGALILFQDTLKWRRGEKTVFEVRLQNEVQRIYVFRKFFGIELDLEDQEAIRGTVSELK
ncbi:arylamine N-acetyltransferase 3 [Hypoxylon sp. FL0543]|nr:arylamine N-acetyltransferase 3 [Hypoxylon sp. FL0543]